MEAGKCQTGRVLMNIEYLENQLELYNQKLIKYDKFLKKIPVRKLQHYFFMRFYLPIINKRDYIFRVLRTATREKYPERFIGDSSRCL